MYILMLEDGRLLKKETISEEEIDSAESGILTIISIDSISEFSEYYDGNWINISDCEN